MTFRRIVLAATLCATCVSLTVAADPAALKPALSREILAPQQTLTEVQNFCAARVPPLPQATTVAEFEKYAAALREETLQRAVYRGEAAQWRDAPLKLEWLDSIAGGPGYRIKKLRYEALPGLWIPALLYEPEHLAAKVPVSLAVNGHDGAGKAAPYKQMRCINMAKRGMLVLNVEWFGMGQLRIDNFQHYRMNQLDLCGTSGLAPFYLAMKKGLDVLLGLPHADSSRVCVTGLSGGGWQTIVISALDPRVTLSNPVAGYSSFITRGKNFSDLGDSEQTPVDLATVSDYSHLTVLRAPRPTLLTYNLNDNCCFKADHALPPLLAAARPFYRLYGKDNLLQYHINAEPGDHNFEKENREALYQMLWLHFFANDPNYLATEIPSDGEVKKPEELNVEIPAGNEDFHTLAMSLAKSLPRDAVLPADKAAAGTWQQERRAKLAEIVKFKKLDVQAEPVDRTKIDDTDVVYWKLKLGSDWTVPAVELTRGEPKETVLLVSENGRAALTEQTEKLLASGNRVVAIDPFYFGECKIPQRDFLFGLLVSAVGERPLGIQASQVAAVSRWLNDGPQKKGEVTVIAVGPRSSLFALVAAALEEKAVAGVELTGTYGSLKQVLEQNMGVNQSPELFTFGLLEAFDLRQIAALVAPRPVALPGASDRARQELAPLKEWYKMLGRDWDFARQ
jgi:dienelactone hydrolase